MRKLLIFFLAGFMLVQTAWQIKIVTAFYRQQEYFARNYCENIANATMHCDGKCYLAKILQKHEEKKGADAKVYFLKLTHFFLAMHSVIFYTPISTLKFPSDRAHKIIDNISQSVFRPPKIAVLIFTFKQ